LVGTTKVYPGPGADIVMESITLIKPCSAISFVEGQSFIFGNASSSPYPR